MAKKPSAEKKPIKVKVQRPPPTLPKVPIKIGRPNEYDIEMEAQALLEWAQTDRATSMLKFAAERMYPVDYLCRWANESEIFCSALNVAKAMIGARREELASQGLMPEGIQKRTHAMYDKMTHAFEREEKTFDASLKKDVEASKPNIIVNVTDYSKGS